MESKLAELSNLRNEIISKQEKKEMFGSICTFYSFRFLYWG